MLRSPGAIEGKQQVPSQKFCCLADRTLEHLQALAINQTIEPRHRVIALDQTTPGNLRGPRTDKLIDRARIKVLLFLEAILELIALSRPIAQII